MSVLKDNSHTHLYVSARRVFVLVGAGLSPVYICGTLFIDPTCRLLALSATVVVAGVVLLLLWRWREKVVQVSSPFLTPMRGACWGFLFWCLFAATFFVLGSIPNRLPDPFHFVVSRIHTICALLSYPVGVGGWLFLWGDNGPPHPMLESFTFNMLVGVAMNMALGALVFSSFEIARGRRNSQQAA